MLEYVILFLYSTIQHKKQDVELKHDLLSFCRQIALGLNYLSSKGFVHRDLAARNILISTDDVCKVEKIIEVWNSIVHAFWFKNWINTVITFGSLY